MSLPLNLPHGNAAVIIRVDANDDWFSLSPPTIQNQKLKLK